MAKVINTVSLAIEVQSGIDNAGDPIYTKKTFSNVRKDVDVDKLSAVAAAIKEVISVQTGESYIIENSII